MVGRIMSSEEFNAGYELPSRSIDMGRYSGAQSETALSIILGDDSLYETMEYNQDGSASFRLNRMLSFEEIIKLHDHVENEVEPLIEKLKSLNT